MKRTAYLLTCNVDSDRTQFSKKVLEEIGFDVLFFQAIPHSNRLLSHRQSMMEIFRQIANGAKNELTNHELKENESKDDNEKEKNDADAEKEKEWFYIFEDDVNTLADIRLDEIVQYEKISNRLFYLGICKYGANTLRETGHIINNHRVRSVSGFVRGAHAFAFSREGVNDFLHFVRNNRCEYIDMMLESYTVQNPANVVRVDLESYIRGHLGVIFQDRNKFASIIGC